MISESSINRVRDLAVRDVLGHYIQDFQRRGSKLVCRCPFHSERTPSFTVTPARNTWHCFGCGKGGDGIAFVMEHERIGFIEAVEAIAKNNGVYLERIESEKSDEERRAARHREELIITAETVQKFFVDCLMADNEEAMLARQYAYSRWPQNFCTECGIGYAPQYSSAFMQFAKSKAISEDLLLELGILKKSDRDGSLYPLMRHRITIPIRNKWHRVIGFTARYIGSKEDVAKYVNSADSDIFHKSETIFCLPEATRAARDCDFLILVEGAPDVLRLQSVGMFNVVAPLGTAWTEEHFKALRKVIGSLCFVPDADPPKGKDAFGAGVKAVIKNGATALRMGFDVTVREIPLGEQPLSEKEIAELLKELPEGADPEQIPKSKPVKNDPDSYIDSEETFTSIPEVQFVVWLASKIFSVASSQVEERKCIREIAGLLSYISEKMVLDSCIEQLAKIHGKAKQWRDAMAAAKGERRLKEQPKTLSKEQDREKALLSKFGLFIRNNMYYSAAEDEPVRLSNCILIPLYHIKDDTNGTRIFRIINEYGQEEVIEFREADLVSLSNFQQRIGSLGNYIWKAKIDKLNIVKEFLYTLTDTADLVKQMGWDAVNTMYAFGNGILKDNIFHEVDSLGIVRLPDGHKFYIPATSLMHKRNPNVYQFERMFQHERRSAVTLHDFASKVIDVFGDNGKVGLCFLFATLFRDIIYPIKNCFPLLNLFGVKGSGKTTLATTLQSFFIHGIDPPNLGIASIPSINDRVSQVTNALVVLDEYKNDLDERKIAYLKALWGGSGQTKKNMNGDGKAAQTVVTAAIALCGQDIPTRDIALYSRVIHLTFPRSSFTQEELRRFDDLKEIANLGNTHLTVEVLNQRRLMEQNYRQNHSLVRRELAEALADDEVETRVLDNWVVPLAAFRTLESALRLPMSYTEMFDITLRGIRYQNEGCKKNTEMADFWEVVESLHSQGRILNKAHFNIRYLTEFKAIGAAEPHVFAKPTPILFLNAAAISTLYTGRVPGGAGGGRVNNWSTILTYLKVQPSFLGYKQDRFRILLPNGTPDFEYDTVNGQQVRKAKVNRPKALCFDYSMLKEAYSLNLETSAVSEADLDAEEAAEAQKATVAATAAPTGPAFGSSQNSLFPPSDDKEELPF